MDAVSFLDSLAHVAQKLKSICSSDVSKFALFLHWMPRWVTHIENESSFNPKILKRYSWGEIVLVDFGFNLGSEIREKHYAIVFEENNPVKSPMLVVIPLSSHKRLKNLAKNDVMLGQVVQGSSKDSVAKVEQIRAISKMRIVAPKFSHDVPIGRASQEQMSKICEKLLKL